MVYEWRDLPVNWRDLPPSVAGVYFFVDGDRPAYIGKSKYLRSRIQSHHSTRSELRSGQWSVYFLVCGRDEMGEIERACIRHYLPVANTQYLKAKTAKPPKPILSPYFPPPPPRLPKDRRSMLAQVICGWRKSTEKTHGDMASLIGISLVDYSRFENGSTPKEETREKIVRWALG